MSNRPNAMTPNESVNGRYAASLPKSAETEHRILLHHRKGVESDERPIQVIGVMQRDKLAIATTRQQ